jgi:hypothetical protein
MIKVFVVPDGVSWAEMGEEWLMTIPQITKLVRNKNSKYLKGFFKIILGLDGFWGMGNVPPQTPRARGAWGGGNGEWVLVIYFSIILVRAIINIVSDSYIFAIAHCPFPIPHNLTIL